VTFLFTDVERSTQLLHDLGAEHYAEALAEHRRVIRDACAEYDGVEVATDGDALFVAFPTASGALEAAASFSAGLAEGLIRVRTGLHTGTPLIAEDNYVGLDVNLAARIAASGHGGQIVLSKTTYDLLDDGFSLTDLGEHRLKDITDPVWIFQLGGEQFPPLKTISNTNVPRPVSSFVGRDRELAELVTRVRDGARLVSLTGSGGSGKTRLAIETAFELIEDFPSGVFWVGLASLRDPAVVLETISQTFGAKEELAIHIGGRKMLLVLDNLEQVIEAAPELSALLVSCPNLSMLVTSRELLRVQGELEYQVPPLANPEAVELFCTRARIEPSESVAELCARLDNQPLAVELAAARITLLSPEQILERLSQRLDFLQGGRDADPRQQTLRATIEWSHDLLSAAEQQLFGRLSVFAGSFDLEAAEAVSDGDLDDLQLLIDKSLLRRTEEGRFFMLETIREYALERLEQSQDAARIRNAHTLYFLALAETAMSELQGSAQLEWLRQLETEHDNMRAALEWTLAPAGLPDRAELGLRLAGALGRFWYIRAHALEGSAWLERAIAAADEQNHLRAKALQALGTLLDQRGERSRAMEVLEESVRLYRAAGDAVRITAALNSLGIVARNQGDLRRARAYLTESLELRRELGDRAAVSTTTCDLGLVAFDEGNVDEAHALFEQSLALDRELGDRGGEAINLNNLGAVALAQGDVAAAAHLLGGGLRAFAEVGDREGVAEALELAASVASRWEQCADAARLAGAAAALRRAIGIPIASDADQSRLERELEATRESLGEPEFASAWAAGEALSEEAAVAAALRLLEEPAR
jgi:predicted ATPase